MDESYTTPEALAAAGASTPAYKQWTKNRRLVLTGGEDLGKGNRRRHAFSDVLQIAVAAELSRLGIPPFRARLVWLACILPNLHRPDLMVLMSPQPDGRDLTIRVVLGDDDDGLDLPDAPVAFAVLRLLPLYERVRDRLAALRGVAA